jgi:hypothetical protein
MNKNKSDLHARNKTREKNTFFVTNMNVKPILQSKEEEKNAFYLYLKYIYLLNEQY